MSTTLAVKESTAVSWTPDQMKLITDTVAKGATSDELKLFLYRAQKLGLDPLKPGQIYFVKYGTAPGTIVIGIDGFRSVAERTGKRSGTSRGVIRNDKGVCIGAWAEIYRSDWQRPARVEVSLAEYSTGRGTWLKMPETMIVKVAEVAALRMAFPDDLGGLYSDDEMAKAQEKGRVFPEQPGEGNGSTEPSGYKIPYGKFAGRKIEELEIEGPKGLKSYLNWLEGLVNKGQPLDEWQKEFISIAEDYIASLETLELDPHKTLKEVGKTLQKQENFDNNKEGLVNELRDPRIVK